MTGVPRQRASEDAPERVVRVGIVDDHRLVLDALSSWLTAEADDVAVEIAVTSWEALLADPRFPVDVVLLDLELGDGVPVGSKIVRLGTAGVPVVVIGSFADPRRVRECLAAGASGYVPKAEDAGEIPRAIRAAAAGEGYVSAALAALLVASEQDPAAEPPPPLSQQERRALVLYASGLPLKSVAEHLDISTETAKTYLGRVREKYAQAGREARTKIALHRRAVEDGLIAAESPYGELGA
jgi:two-component system, NarL family, uhpT operon response regulator UhpA